MKKLTIWFWIVTILFSLFMLSSAIPDIQISEKSVAMYTGLGYPKYLIIFMGIAKLLGIIVILIPGRSRIKEWAYAGLFFDLIGASYSATVMSPTFEPAILIMILPITFLFISYFLWHRRMELEVAKAHAH